MVYFGFLDIYLYKKNLYQNSIKDLEDEGGAVELEMANVVGVFYVLVGGSIFALIFVFILILLDALKVSREMKVRFF